MGMLYRIKRAPVRYYKRILYFLSPWLSDEFFIKAMFLGKMGCRVNLKNPKTYQEKLQWLKLHNRNPEYTTMVDKYEVKHYITSKWGDIVKVIPTIGVWDHFEEIDFHNLPDEFVLKTTHDSGTVVICRDKSQFDIIAAKEKLEKSLKRNYFLLGREWPYKDVKPRIIAEEFMVDESGSELKDYKWFCFDGEPKAMFIASDRFSVDEETKFDFFDMDFNHLPCLSGHPNSNKKINKPRNFDKMKEIAKLLSKGIPHVRVDFYDINGTLYFGEFTFFHHTGFVHFEPKEWDYKFGDWIKLPNVTIQ